MKRVAVIGGTGLETLSELGRSETRVVSTVFGDRTLIVCATEFGELLFQSRHGEDHSIAPHRIDYQANIETLRVSGVTDILATNAVGSLRGDLAPLSIVVMDDFIDFTRGRAVSFWDGHPKAPHSVVHTNFAPPYAPDLRNAVLQAAAGEQIAVVDGGTYLCAEGPRFESPAEIRMFRSWGADVVGMTGLPEAVFVREAGIRYAALGLVTNLGAGLDPRNGSVDHERHVDAMALLKPKALAILLSAARSLLSAEN